MPNIIKITDFSDPQLDFYARLSEKQLLHYYEPDTGLFIAESPKVVQRAIDAGHTPLSFLVEDKHLETQAAEIINAHPDIPVYTAPFEVLTQLTGFNLTRGMLAVLHRGSLPTVEQVCNDARRVVVLENVMNPTNIGAIFRSAAALNMDAVILTNGCSDPLYRRAARVSMGTVFQIPWTFCDNWQEKLHLLGFKTAAMALCDDTVNIDDKNLMAEEKLAVVMGTEGDGLAKQTISDCDYTVKIPMAHGVDSLNVAAASAVAFWQLGNR
ncbi:MAG: RNA methyltransferase [Oscillospiraceae bacterium]|nr:RNA methyltransferase [Oscillospiraceae bacterium]